MIMRIFVTLLVLGAGYLGYEVYNLYNGKAYLNNIPQGYHFGPDEADLTVVKFMDYSCAFCREAHPTIMQAVAQDGNVKFAPFPILSQNSDGSSAAYLLYAAGKMGKFQEAHEYLIENNTNLIRDRLPEITSDLGVDEAEFKEHLDSAEVYNRVQDNHRAFINLNNFATPTFFIGPNLRYIPTQGMPTVDDFLKMFEEARASQ